MYEERPTYIRSLAGLEHNPRGPTRMPLAATKSVSVERFVDYFKQGGHAVVLGVDFDTVMKMQGVAGRSSANQILREHRLLNLVKSPYVMPSRGLVSMVIGTDEHIGFLMPRMQVPIFEGMPREDLSRCILQIGKAIDDTHLSGVTHGDIHDGNILYDPLTRNYLLADFSTGEFSNKKSGSRFRSRCISDRTYFIQTVVEIVARKFGLIASEDKRNFSINDMRDIYGQETRIGQFLEGYREQYENYDRFGSESKLSEVLLRLVNDDFSEQ